MYDTDKLARAIEFALTSPNEMDSNMETANIVDGVYRLARAIEHLAKAVDTVGTAYSMTGGSPPKVDR